jgi:hypothetical protein
VTSADAITVTVTLPGQPPQRIIILTQGDLTSRTYCSEDFREMGHGGVNFKLLVSQACHAILAG